MTADNELKTWASTVPMLPTDIWRQMKRLATCSRDDSALTKGPIIKEGDLVMRKLINRKSKLHLKRYQLAMANGYILQTLTNSARLRKPSSDEVTRYTGEFWHASSRLRLHNQLAKQSELHDLDVALHKATTAHLEAQQRREPVSLGKHAELSAKRQQALRNIRDTEAHTNAATKLKPETIPTQCTRRIIRLLSRYRN